jgi:hypothetical protein
MISRLGMTGAAVAVVALGVGAVGPVFGAGGDGDHGDDEDDTIRVTATRTEQGFVDVGDAGFSLGDQFVFTAELTSHGRQVGHEGVICSVTSVATEERQCVGSVWFDDVGEITVQGLYAGAPQVFSFPITGGSGAYEGAEGVLQVRELGGDRQRQIFHLDD